MAVLSIGNTAHSNTTDPNAAFSDVLDLEYEKKEDKKNKKPTFYEKLFYNIVRSDKCSGDQTSEQAHENILICYLKNVCKFGDYITIGNVNGEAKISNLNTNFFKEQLGGSKLEQLMASFRINKGNVSFQKIVRDTLRQQLEENARLQKKGKNDKISPLISNRQWQMNTETFAHAFFSALNHAMPMGFTKFENEMIALSKDTSPMYVRAETDEVETAPALVNATLKTSNQH